MSELTASKLRKLQNMALHGTPPEQANAKFILRNHGISEQEQYATAAQNPQPTRKNYMAGMGRYRRERDEEERKGAARAQREKTRAEHLERMLQEALAIEQEVQAASRHHRDLKRLEYTEMLEAKHKAKEYKPPQYHRATQPPHQEQPAPAEANIATIIALALIMALLFAL